MKSNSPIHGADSNWKPKGVNVSHLIGLTPPDRVRGSDCDNLWKTSCFMMWPWCQGNSRTSCFMIEERKCGWDSSDSQEHVRLDTLQPPCLRHPYLSLSQDNFFPPRFKMWQNWSFLALIKARSGAEGRQIAEANRAGNTFSVSPCMAELRLTDWEYTCYGGWCNQRKGSFLVTQRLKRAMSNNVVNSVTGDKVHVFLFFAFFVHR